MPLRRELPLERADEDIGVHKDAAGDVRAVEAGEREEHGGEDAVVGEESKLRVLVELTRDEPDPEGDRRYEPPDEATAIPALDRVDRELHGHARGEQRHGVDRDERD